MKRTSGLRRGKPLARGQLLKAGKPMKRGAKLKARKTPRAFRQRRDPQYAVYVRMLPCLIGGPWRAKLFADAAGRFYEHVCTGRVEVCHVRSRGAGGDDRGNVVPMCWGAHEEQHRIGIRSFQARWKVDLKAAAANYWAAYQRETGVS